MKTAEDVPQQRTTPNISTLSGVANMAKVTGPLLSMSASGSIAGAMVFSNSKGRPYVRQLVTPSNPNSDAQQGVRANMKGLNLLWAAMSDLEKATWDTKAKQDNVSTWNAFVKVNQKDFAEGYGDQRQDPAEASDPPSIPTDVSDSVAGSQVTVLADVPATGETFGMMLWVSPTTGFTPAKNNVKQVIAVTEAVGTPQTFTLNGLSSGTYFYKVAGFDFAGIIGTKSAEGSFVIA